MKVKRSFFIGISSLLLNAMPTYAAPPQIVSAYISAALKSDGTIWAWGDSCGSNVAGQLKDSTNKSLSNVKGISNSGYYGVLAINGDGTLSSLSGCGKWKDTWQPVKDSAGKLVTNVVQASGGGNTAFVKEDGTVWNFGGNDYGQLGTGQVGGSSAAAVQVKVSATTFLTGVKSVRVGEIQSIALKKDGTVWIWGYSWMYPGNYYAIQVKDNKGTPITNVDSIGMGGQGVFHIIKNDGSLWAVDVRFGGGGYPIQYKNGTPLTDITVVDGTDMYGCAAGIAVHSSGNVWQWACSPMLYDASNSYPAFQVKTDSSTYLADVKTVAGTIYNTLALKNDGTVWQWGTGKQGMSTPIGGHVASQVMDMSGKPLRLIGDAVCYP